MRRLVAIDLHLSSFLSGSGAAPGIQQPVHVAEVVGDFQSAALELLEQRCRVAAQVSQLLEQCHRRQAAHIVQLG